MPIKLIKFTDSVGTKHDTPLLVGVVIDRFRLWCFRMYLFEKLDK